MKVTKEKIKETEEEWQHNLLNWKSKRRQSKEGATGPETNNSAPNSNSGSNPNSDSDEAKRKIKTFGEMLKEKAKAGQRLGYSLHRYVEGEEDPSIEMFTETSKSEEENDNEIEITFNKINSDNQAANINDGDEEVENVENDINLDTLRINGDGNNQHHNHQPTTISNEDNFEQNNINQRESDYFTNNSQRQILVSLSLLCLQRLLMFLVLAIFIPVPACF